MREEIEAAVTFLTRLLAKSVSDPGGGSSGSKDQSTTSNGLTTCGGNTTSTINTVKDTSATTTTATKNDHHNYNNNHNQTNNPHITNQPLTEEKIKKFSQKLIDILTQRYQNHWYPGHPSKGQAYRCIRINQNCRIDCSIESACQQVGISYESLRLPVELTLWVDPSEVTCRFGEHKGSFCIVAKLGDGRQENFADSINIDELEQRSIDRSKQSFENSRMKMKTHASQQQRQLLAGHHVTSAKQVARNQVTIQAQSAIMNQFSTTIASSSNMNNNVSYHAMNGGVNSLPNGGLTSQNNHHITSHGSPVGGSLTNGFAVDYPANNGLTTTVFAPVGTGTNGSTTAGLPFQPTPGANGAGTGSQPYQYSPAQYFNHFHHQLPTAAAAAANFQHHQQQQAAAVAALHPNGSWSSSSHLFGPGATNKFMAGLTGGSPQQNPTSSTPPSTSVSGGQLQTGGGRTPLSSNHLSSPSMTPGGAGSISFRSIQVNNSLTSSSASTPSSSLATSQVSTNSKSNSQQLSSSNNVLSNGGLTNPSNNANSNNNNNNSANSNNAGGGANPNAPVFIPRGFLHMSNFNLSAPPFTPASLANNFQSIDQTSANGSNTSIGSTVVTKDRRSFSSNASSVSTSSSVISPSVASPGSAATATGTPLVANNRF